MKEFLLNIAALATGSIITINGMNLANVRYVGEKKSEKERKDGKEALTYYQFAIGGRSFTIDSNDMDSVELLRDKAKRATVGQLTLEATEFDVPVLDADGNPTGDSDKRQAFRFMSVITAADAIALVRSAGQIAKEESQWTPKDNAVTEDRLAKLITDAMAKATPVAAPIGG